MAALSLANVLAATTPAARESDAVSLSTFGKPAEVTLDTGDGRRKALSWAYAVGTPIWGHVQMKNLRATADEVAASKGHELAHVSQATLRDDRDAGRPSRIPCKHSDGFAVVVLVSKATSQVLVWTEGKGACKGAKAAAKAAADKAPAKAAADKAPAKAAADKAPAKAAGKPTLVASVPGFGPANA